VKKSATYTTWLLLFVAYGLYYTASQAATDSRQPLKIRRVALNSKTFNPSNGRSVTLNFEITAQADVTVKIYDRLARQVRCFDLSLLEPGIHSIQWDGKKQDGTQAPGNVFLYIIEAANSLRKTIYNPAGKTAGLLVKAYEFNLDKETGVIEYVLPKACMIRLRAGLGNGMLAQTIFDWQPRTAGRHSYKWLGKDASGLINLLKHPQLDLNLTCYTLPANTIIFTGQTKPFESKKNNPQEQIAEKPKNLWAEKGKYFHYTHDVRDCHEPRFNILFPKAEIAGPADAAVVSGVTQIRIQLEPLDAAYLINKRFEIMLYVDGVFLFEMEEGSCPFNYNWDTRGLRKGPHTLTVNLVSYDGHIGAISRKVFVGD